MNNGPIGDIIKPDIKRVVLRKKKPKVKRIKIRIMEITYG